MENTEKTLIGDETKGLFRASSSWMRAYSITMLVALGIIFLCLLILLFQNEILYDLMSTRGRVNEQFSDMINGFLILMIIIVATFGYAFIKLLSSGNKFTTISYSSKKDDMVSAFRNLRFYWMISGIGIIVVMVVAFYIGFKMIPAMR